MLPNILCSHICSHIVLGLVNGWKILVAASDMWLQGWVYMPRGVFFAIGCILSLVQGDYKVCSCMCPLRLKFCLLQLKL
jgi:hypothetical protein